MPSPRDPSGGEIDTPGDLQRYEHMLRNGELTLEDAESI